jgi:hypothetical protein
MYLFAYCGAGDRFCGIYHRATREVVIYSRGQRGKGANKEVYSVDDPQLQQLIEADVWETFQEEIELLEVSWTEMPLIQCIVLRPLDLCRYGEKKRFCSWVIRLYGLNLYEIRLTQEDVNLVCLMDEDCLGTGNCLWKDS